MVHPLRDKAAVSGIGETAYTRGTSKSGLALQLEASLRALDDAGIDPRDVDGVIPYFPGGAIAEDFIANLGLPDLKLSLFVPMGGATCVAAIQSAAMAVAIIGFAGATSAPVSGASVLSSAILAGTQISLQMPRSTLARKITGALGSVAVTSIGRVNPSR